MKLTIRLQYSVQECVELQSPPPLHLHHVALIKHRDNFASFLVLNNTYSMSKIFFTSNDHDNRQMERLVE
jgi:hypothetical protein